jgi:hypothetical protein
MMKTAYLNKSGQSATELAIYGAILIFVIGGIVSAAFSSSFQQSQQLKAMRQAMLSSWESSKKKETSGNSTSILYIQDKVSPDLNKYGPADRVPNIISSSGTFTAQLMQPIDWPDDPVEVDKTIPVMDVFVNGQHFKFKMAGFTEYFYVNDGEFGIQSCINESKIRKCTIRLRPSEMTNALLPIFYQMALPSADNGQLTAQQSADLNRNGNYFDDPPVTPQRIAAWKWTAPTLAKVQEELNPKKQQYPSYDIDGDGQEEVIYFISGNTLRVLDHQQGDIDFSRDYVGTTGRKPGLQNDTVIYTPSNSPQKSYLQIKEGKAYNPENGAFVRSVSFTDQASVIERRIQLTADTGSMCNGTEPTPPVEVCGDCFSADNAGRTCFDRDTLMLYVRSSITDKRGRSWRTDIGQK